MSNSMEKWLEDKRPNSFLDISPLQDSFDRLFNDLLMIKRANGTHQNLSFSPSCEVSEEGNNYVLKFDLPGVSKDQVKVEVDRDQLTVKAERTEEKKREDKKKYLSEVYYGSFQRTFTLPEQLDEMKVDAKFQNGVLTIQIPKSKQTNLKQIPVQ